MKLADFQRQMMQDLLAPQQVSHQLRTISQQPEQLDQRLAFYRESIHGGRFTVLRRIFSCLYKLLGEQYFQQMADVFLLQYPSQHSCIDQMGEFFVEFVAKHDVLDHVPYAADMAQFEWLWHLVFHGETNPCISAQSNICSGKVTLAKGLQTMSSPYPLHLLWEMCQPEYQGEFALPSSNRQFYFALVQRQQAIYIEQLSEELWHGLQNLDCLKSDQIQQLLKQGLLY